MDADAQRYVTDGGLETDLIFHHGIDLPEFAAFVLLDSRRGRRLLRDYYRAYGDIARANGAGLRLESATWRASADWGARLGYDATALDRINREAVSLMRAVAEDYADLPDVSLVGMLGPRGDGYRPGTWDPTTGADDALTYHRPQVQSLTAAGVDIIAAYTLSDAAEAIGIVRAARDEGIPVEISFTVETDGRLATGSTLAETIDLVDAGSPADGYLLNCAHPDHFAHALDAATVPRIVGLRPNASRRSHAELDESETIDEGDPADLAIAVAALAERMPSVRVIGGCCGTDARHVALMWDALVDR